MFEELPEDDCVCVVVLERQPCRVGHGGLRDRAREYRRLVEVDADDAARARFERPVVRRQLTLLPREAHVDDLRAFETREQPPLARAQLFAHAAPFRATTPLRAAMKSRIRSARAVQLRGCASARAASARR